MAGSTVKLGKIRAKKIMALRNDVRKKAWMANTILSLKAIYAYNRRKYLISFLKKNIINP